MEIGQEETTVSRSSWWLFYISNETALKTMWMGVGALQDQIRKALGIMAEQAII